MKKTKTRQIGRLAMRHEGTFWNAYYALTNTMEDAILLGSIQMQFVAGHKDRKEAFMLIMMAAVSDILEEETGQRPTWNEPTPGPESERAGHS